MNAQAPKVSNITLIGMMGSGKSTVGQIMASRMGWRFVDTDALIEQEMHQSVERIFAQYGEKAFRQKETEVICRVMNEKHQVVATGGGAVLAEENRRYLWDRSCVVWLDAQPQTLAARVGDQPETRPLIAGQDLIPRLSNLLDQRRPLYSQAHVRIVTDGLDPEAVAEKILDELQVRFYRA